MAENQELILSIYEGWQAYQQVITKVIAPLNSDQLALCSTPNLRYVGEIAAHIVGARARWFFLLMGEGGDEFKAFGKWDCLGAKSRSAEGLVSGLEATWIGMHQAIDRLTPEDWDKTWPGPHASCT